MEDALRRGWSLYLNKTSKEHMQGQAGKVLFWRNRNLSLKGTLYSVRQYATSSELCWHIEVKCFETEGKPDRQATSLEIVTGQCLFRDPCITSVTLLPLCQIIYFLFGFPWFSSKVSFENSTLAALQKNKGKNVILWILRLNRRRKDKNMVIFVRSKESKPALEAGLHMLCTHAPLHVSPCYILTPTVYGDS